MTVGDLRAALFTIKNQDATVCFQHPCTGETYDVEIVIVTNQAAASGPGETEAIEFDTTLPANQVLLAMRR